MMKLQWQQYIVYTISIQCSLQFESYWTYTLCAQPSKEVFMPKTHIETERGNPSMCIAFEQDLLLVSFFRVSLNLFFIYSSNAATLPFVVLFLFAKHKSRGKIPPTHMARMGRFYQGNLKSYQEGSLPLVLGNI